MYISFMNQFHVFPDAPVHPPVSETHPYDNQDPKNMPADTGYGCKMVDGVVHVYTKKTNMDKCVFVPVGCLFKRKKEVSLFV